MSTTTSTNLAVAGLASGFDWQSLVTQLIAVERDPETAMRTNQTTLQEENNAYGSIATQLGTLNNSIATLNDPSLFDSRLATPSDATVATATAAAAAPLGTYSFNITQLATSAVQQGTQNSGKPLSATDNVSGLVLGSAAFVSPLTAGTFTVNGKSVTIATSDTLQSAFDKISTATGGSVLGSYDSGTDTISLNSSSPIVLGSATDTSNFLQVAKLYNNGGGLVTSASALGSVQLGGTLASANLSTAITDGGSGAGSFQINGVQISYDDSTDSIGDVLNRINNSAAGVTATYDNINDRFLLTDKATGDVGISMQDVTGNFLAATGLSGGTLQRGANLLYKINSGGTLTSQSNIIDQSSSGLTGLTVTAEKTGTVSVSVSADISKISSAITDFVTQYNAAQQYIDSQTASTTDATGKVTAGLLTGDADANEMETKLRQLADATVGGGLQGSITTLDSLGIVSNGNDNTLTAPNTTTLTAALTNNLSAVKSLFTDPTSGLATNMSTYLNSLIGDNGSVVAKQADLTKQSSAIDANIATMELKITDDQSRLTNEFVAMETAEATINQQKQYLTSAFPSTG